MVIILSRR